MERVEPYETPRTAPPVYALGTASDRVPLSQKLGYGFGSLLDMWGHWLYPGLAFQVFNIFLGVSPALVSTALMLNRLFDAAADPFFGWISDNTRTRFGRRRPYILAGSLLSGVGLPLLFAAGHGWTELQYFGFMLASSLLYIPAMSCFNMPYLSLGAELTPDTHERTRVMAVKRAMQTLPELAMFFAAQFTTLALFSDPVSGKPDILRGAQVYCSILGAGMIAAGIAVFALVREPYYAQVVARGQPRVSIQETLWKTLTCRPFRIQVCVKLAYAVGTSMVGVLGYYTTVYYVCRGDLALGTKWNTVMGASGLVFGLLGVPLFAAVAQRLGKRRGQMCVLGSAILVFVSTWWTYDPAQPWLQVFASGLIACTSAGFWMLDGSIAADIIDYDELQTGQRREGTFSACASWISKVGIALGAGSAGWILACTGFDAERGGLQAEHSLRMIRILLAAIPIAGLAIAMGLLSRYPLTTEKNLEIRAALEQRRGKV